MAFKKRKGQVSPNYKKYKDGVVIRPSKYYHAHGSLMVGSIDGEIICDQQGKPVPYGQLNNT